MPERLQGKNLLHLLDDLEQDGPQEEAPEKPKVNFISLLFSKKWAPYYSLAAAIIFVAILIPRLATPEMGITMPVEAPVSETALVTGEAALEKNLPQLPAEEAADAMPAMAPEASAEPAPEAMMMDSVEADDSAVRMQPRGFGGAGMSYYVGEGGGFVFYSRIVDPTDPVFDGATLVLDVIDATSQEVILQQSMSGVSQLTNAFLSNDILYTVGFGDGGIQVSGYSGLAAGQLHAEDKYQIAGDYRESLLIGQTLRLTSVLYNRGPDTADQIFALPDADGTHTFLLTMIDLETRTTGTTAITNVPDAAYSIIEDNSVIFYYSNSKQEEVSKRYYVNGYIFAESQ